MANNVDPDQIPHSVVSNLALHCLLRPVHLNTYGKLCYVQSVQFEGTCLIYWQNDINVVRLPNSDE